MSWNTTSALAARDCPMRANCGKIPYVSADDAWRAVKAEGASMKSRGTLRVYRCGHGGCGAATWHLTTTPIRAKRRRTRPLSVRRGEHETPEHRSDAA